MAGYSVIVQQIMAQMGDDRPTHTFLPVGVGGLASAIVAPFWCAPPRAVQPSSCA